MTHCERFEREGLVALERGDPLDEHFSSCPDCRREREAYERLGRALGANAEAAAPVGWQVRVRETIERRARARVQRRRLALGGLATAAAVALVVVLLPGRSQPLAISVEVHSGGRTVRGAAGTVGDRLQVTTTGVSMSEAEIRVYRDDIDLVLRCSSDPPCSRRRDRLVAELVLDLRGEYQALVLVADHPLPPPTSQSLDRDVEAVLAAGGSVLLAEEIDVR